MFSSVPSTYPLRNPIIIRVLPHKKKTRSIDPYSHHVTCGPKLESRPRNSSVEQGELLYSPPHTKI